MRGREHDAGRRFELARVVIAGAPLLALGVFALLRWADWGSGPTTSASDPTEPAGQTELLVWEALITAQVAVWVVLAGIGLRALRDLDAHADAWLTASPEERRARWRRETAGFLAFVYGLIALLFALGASSPASISNPVILIGQQWKIWLVFALAGAAILPLLVVLKRTQLCAAEAGGWSATAGDIERILVLRRHLRTATASLGTVIALYLISSGALSDAVEAAGREPVPDSIVLVAGVWFTAVLAAIYLHVFTSVDRRARALLERAAPLPDPSPAAAEAFTATAHLRRELSAELELGGDARKNLEGLIGVFSPLAAALLNRFVDL